MRVCANCGASAELVTDYNGFCFPCERLRQKEYDELMKRNAIEMGHYQEPERNETVENILSEYAEALEKDPSDYQAIVRIVDRYIADLPGDDWGLLKISILEKSGYYMYPDPDKQKYKGVSYYGRGFKIRDKTQDQDRELPVHPGDRRGDRALSYSGTNGGDLSGSDESRKI
jgi:hypothetical protein